MADERPYKLIYFRSARTQEYFFRFVGRNGEKMAQSEGYKNPADCMNAAEAVTGTGQAVERKVTVVVEDSFRPAVEHKKDN